MRRRQNPWQNHERNLFDGQLYSRCCLDPSKKDDDGEGWFHFRADHQKTFIMLRPLLVTTTRRSTVSASCLLLGRRQSTRPAALLALASSWSTYTRRDFASSAPPPQPSSEEPQRQPSNFAIPPNLTIDPRSSFAPIPKKLPKVALPQELVENEEEEQLEAASAEEDYLDEDDGEYYDEDEQGELVLPLPQVMYAKPLPERLHVDIETLFAPLYSDPSSAVVGTLWLDDTVFGKDPVRVDLMKRAVLYYRNKARGRRKAHSKTISEVSGSGRKIRPQKGQGMARVGHRRPAHHRGGAKAHGPKNTRDYGQTKLNKKVRKQALCSALSQRLLEGNLIVVNQLYDADVGSHKTRDLVKLLDDRTWGGKDGASALILDAYYHDDNDDPNNDKEESQDDRSQSTVPSYRGVPVPFYLAAANIPKITMGSHHDASVYQILRHDKLVLTLASVQALENRLSTK